MIHKNHKKFFLRISFFLFAFTVFISCDKKTDKSIPDYVTTAGQYRDTSGPINIITIVSDSVLFSNLVPFLAEDSILGRLLPATFIPETFYGFRNFLPEEFQRKQETRIVMNILKGEPNFISKPSIYAKNQAYMEIYGNSLEEVKGQIQKNKKLILEEADKANYSFLRSKLNVSSHKETLGKLGVSMQIPKEYNLIKDSTNYQWYRRDVIKNTRTENQNSGSISALQDRETFNIQISKFPLDKISLEKEDIKTLINYYGLYKLKGDKPTEYMEVQQDYYDIDKEETVKQFKIYEFDGMWDMKTQDFGGSFVGKIVINTIKKEGYLCLNSFYAPNPKHKRDNIIQQLTLLNTFNVMP